MLLNGTARSASRRGYFLTPIRGPCYDCESNEFFNVATVSTQQTNPGVSFDLDESWILKTANALRARVTFKAFAIETRRDDVYVFGKVCCARRTSRPSKVQHLKCSTNVFSVFLAICEVSASCPENISWSTCLILEFGYTVRPFLTAKQHEKANAVISKRRRRMGTVYANLSPSRDPPCKCEEAITISLIRAVQTKC